LLRIGVKLKEAGRERLSWSSEPREERCVLCIVPLPLPVGGALLRPERGIIGDMRRGSRSRRRRGRSLLACRPRSLRGYRKG
jgi:hypothetical protein